MAALTETRLTLQRIAVHILARRRFAVSGRFGLRSSPGGFATPAFGPEPEVLRVANDSLVREVGGQCRSRRIEGSTLESLAAFAGVDLSDPFEAGRDTPAAGDPSAPLSLDQDALSALAAWWDLGWTVLDLVVSSLPDEAGAATTQLWPEHFDAATHVAVPTGERVNLGFSPGDSFSERPYLYLGPWTGSRPGPAGYWNAPFGAYLTMDEALAGGDPRSACGEFLTKGLALFSG